MVRSGGICNQTQDLRDADLSTGGDTVYRNLQTIRIIPQSLIVSDRISGGNSWICIGFGADAQEIRFILPVVARKLRWLPIGHKPEPSPPTASCNSGLRSMTNKHIIITAEDFQRLEALLASSVVRLISDSDRLDELKAELRRARVVPQDHVPSDVVTMNSTVSLRDLRTNEVETYTLVYPERADIANNKLSVLAPIGTAILGYRAGDEFSWHVPQGWRELKVEEVIYQPERDRALRV